MTGYRESEYCRRNLQVARVIGAKAAVDQALEHALTMKRFPKWLLAYLESAAERLPGLSADLAAFRDASPDYNEFGPPAAAAFVAENNRRIANVQAKSSVVTGAK